MLKVRLLRTVTVGSPLNLLLWMDFPITLNVTGGIIKDVFKYIEQLSLLFISFIVYMPGNEPPNVILKQF